MNVLDLKRGARVYWKPLGAESLWFVPVIVFSYPVFVEGERHVHVVLPNGKMALAPIDRLEANEPNGIEIEVGDRKPKKRYPVSATTQKLADKLPRETWITLDEVMRLTPSSDPARRLRELRSLGLTIDKRPTGHGDYEYRISL